MFMGPGASPARVEVAEVDGTLEVAKSRQLAKAELRSDVVWSLIFVGVGVLPGAIVLLPYLQSAALLELLSPLADPARSGRGPLILSLSLLALVAIVLLVLLGWGRATYRRVQLVRHGDVFAFDPAHNQFRRNQRPVASLDEVARVLVRHAWAWEGTVEHGFSTRHAYRVSVVLANGRRVDIETWHSEADAMDVARRIGGHIDVPLVRAEHPGWKCALCLP
jgi:hypothetical protein